MPLDIAIRTWTGEELTLGWEGETWTEPRGDAVVDTRHLWALPGLADCHAHLSADSLLDVEAAGEPEGAGRRIFAQLQSGVFLVLDKGWRTDFVLTLLNRPPTERPELQAAGRIITGTHGYFPGFAHEVEDHELARLVGEANHSGGWVKLIGDWPQRGRGPVVNFSEAALAEATAIAHAAGSRVAIHTMAAETPGRAVRAGVDSIEHGLYLTPDDLEALGARGGAWVPTIANTEAVMAGFPAGSTAARVLGEGLVNLGRLLPLAAEAGVQVLAGTDLGLAHGGLAAEVFRFRDFGLDERAAVGAAGPNAYGYLGLPTFAIGASADLLLMAGSPSVEPLAQPLFGMRAGKVIFDRAGVLNRR